MEENEEILLNDFLNIRADILIGKKVKSHYLRVVEMIVFLNTKIDNSDKQRDTNLSNKLSSICYSYYRLKDEIMSEMK